MAELLCPVSQDPRTVLVGRAYGDFQKWDTMMVVLESGPFTGCRHAAGQAAQDFKDGDRVALHGSAWYPA